MPAAAPDCLDRIHLEVIARKQVMSGLALVFVILAAVSLRHVERSPQDTGMPDLLVTLLLSLWLPLFIDALVGYRRLADFTWPAARRLLLLWLNRTPERRLNRLRETLTERERNISRLRGCIRDLEVEVRAAGTKGDDPG